jgi:FkbM family methyltransferase
MSAKLPITFDRVTGHIAGAGAWERLIALGLIAGSKLTTAYSHRGYIHAANLLRTTVPVRNIEVALTPDGVFAFPFSEGYWSKLLDRGFKYEEELELLFRHSVDVDYTLIDGGANFGYWSVLTSSTAYGAKTAIAIEPSSDNFAKLQHNSDLNGNRFQTMKCAIGAERGTARLSGAKHEAFSIAGDQSGEEVDVIALDDLIDSGALAANGKYLIKLDVEGVEIEAIKGCARLLQTDSVVLCEEHGSDRNHTVSRYIFDHMTLIAHDPQTGQFVTLKDLSMLDRIKVSSSAGYNVFGTSSAFWLDRFNKMNASALRHAH